MADNDGPVAATGMPMTDKEQFRQAIRNLVDVHHALKEHNARGKEMRAQLNALKTVVLAFMETAALDVCNVNHNGKTGELAVRTSKRTKAVDKETAIEQIERYLAEETQLDHAPARAGLIWDCIQKARVTTEVKNLTVRKM